MKNNVELAFGQKEQAIIEKAGEGDPSVSETAKFVQGKTTKVLAKLAEEGAEIAEALLDPEQSRDDLINEFADLDYFVRILLGNVNRKLGQQGDSPIAINEIQAKISSRRK